MSTITAHRETLYRNTYAALWFVGGIALGVLASLDRPVAGVVVYALAVVGSFALRRRYGGVLFDQRDDHHDQIASKYTLTLFGWASAIVFPALLILYGLGHFTWEPWAIAVAWVIAAIYLTYAVTLAIVARRN